MQPDYNRLWPNINDGQTSDAHFYAFFEDSLNQFISTNSGSIQPTTIKKAEQQQQSLSEEEQDKK